VAVIVLAFVCGRNALADCPKTGRYAVKIDSAPQGAPIYIGDKTCQIGVTPYVGKLNRGDYNVIIETPGYEAATKPFHVAALRKTQELFIPLVKKADPPKIDIRADADPKGVAGATVMLDGEVKGQAPLVIVTTAGRHQLRLQKDGYEAFEQWYSVTDNNTQTVMPTLKEIAKPKYGTVVVDADVPDAEVYIDGNKHPDNTPAIIQNVIEGMHVIEVRKEPALPWKQTVQVTADQQTKVRAELQATLNGGTGVIRVLCDTDGARAALDGTDMGPVPVDIKDVKAGDHIVTVKAPGMQPEDKHVTVAAGSSQIVKVDLNASASGEQGVLKIVSMTPEAEVFIDGADVGKVPQEKRVSAGDHPVVVRLEGFKQFEQKVRVDAGQSVTVQAQLKPVGRLRVLSTPPNANVIINGIPAGKTPLDTEVETGETVVRLEAAGFQPFEQTLQIEGGKTLTLSRELPQQGMTEGEWRAEQRGLSSYGARVLPRGRSTIDFSVGYPYYLEGRINVGAGSINHRFGFDANITVRTMFARTELGLGGRMQFADQEPFSAGLFTNIYYGSKLLDDSQRSGVTWDWGLNASLTALDLISITGRVYAEVWSDRWCPTSKAATPGDPNDVFNGDAIDVCKEFYGGTLSAEDKATVEKLTGWKNPSDVFGRDDGIRIIGSIIAEIAFRQHYSVFLLLEGSPTERAAFSGLFDGSMIGNDDVDFYFKLGLTYKF
jgi:HSP20 family molecular chaperone IbpA